MIMQVYKYTFTKTALKLTKSYINFMRRPWWIFSVMVGFNEKVCKFARNLHKSCKFTPHRGYCK